MKPRPIDTAPRDGEAILVWNDDWWEAAFYDAGKWCGAHHTSAHGNELPERHLTYWLPQPPKPAKEPNDS